MMKYLGFLFLSLTLVGCGKISTPDPVIPGYPESDYQTNYYSDSDPKTDAHLELEHGVVLYDFAQRQSINSPLTVKGVAPRRWYFEAIVPVSLLTLEGEVITVAGGYGPWLEPIDGVQGAEDPIPFEATLEFDDPGIDMGKIRVAKDMSGEGINPEWVETMVLFE